MSNPGLHTNLKSNFDQGYTNRWLILYQYETSYGSVYNV